MSDEIKFVQLKADPQSDDIMAVYADKAKDLYYRFWDGSSWTALAAPLETVISDESQQRSLHVCLEGKPAHGHRSDRVFRHRPGRFGIGGLADGPGNQQSGFQPVSQQPVLPVPISRINDSLIPGLIYSVQGKSYAYPDRRCNPG